MRYTEARMRKAAEDMSLRLIRKLLIGIKFDTLAEPSFFPRLPALLLNGINGIAVGMATNMPPHNISEVVDGNIAHINKRGYLKLQN